jgi:hypothetical protein
VLQLRVIRLLLVMLLVAAVVAALAAAVRAGAGSDSVADIPPLPARSTLEAQRSRFLALAEQGIATAKRYWWDAEYGWYDEQLTNNFPPNPLVMLWAAYQLFEAFDGVAIADPTPPNEAAVEWFAGMAERYYNPLVKPVGAYAYYIGKRDLNMRYYFDDAGWFGLAFLDAYRATGKPRYIRDAGLAYRFLAISGWNRNGGGFWWSTYHDYITSEPLAAGILIAVRLYEITRVKAYLRNAVKWMAWADARSWNASRNLYQRSSTDHTVMSYVEGLMADANEHLCRITHRQAYCNRAELVARASIPAFGVQLHWAPQYDAIDLHGLLDLYSLDHDSSWYALAYVNAQRAAANAADPEGRYVLGWDGKSIDLGQEVHPGQIGLHGATTSLFAWLAVAQPPS